MKMQRYKYLNVESQILQHSTSALENPKCNWSPQPCRFGLRSLSSWSWIRSCGGETPFANMLDVASCWTNVSWEFTRKVPMMDVYCGFNAGGAGSHFVNSSSSRNRLFRNPARTLSSSDCFLIGCKSWAHKTRSFIQTQATRQKSKRPNHSCASLKTINRDSGWNAMRGWCSGNV